MAPGENVSEQAAACYQELLLLCHTGSNEDSQLKQCSPGFRAIFVNAPMDQEMMSEIMSPAPEDAASASAVDKAADEQETLQWRHTQAEKTRPVAKDVVQGLEPKLRMAMLSWMHQVLLPWSLDDRILFRAVMLLDRVCAGRAVPQERLHATSIAVIRIALKLEGQEIPIDHILATVLAGPVNTNMVNEEEIDILKTLGFRITSSTPFEFLTGRVLHQIKEPVAKEVDQGAAFGTWQTTRGILFLALTKPDFYYNYPAAVLAIVALQLAGAKCADMKRGAEYLQK